MKLSKPIKKIIGGRGVSRVLSIEDIARNLSDLKRRKREFFVCLRFGKNNELVERIIFSGEKIEKNNGWLKEAFLLNSKKSPTAILAVGRFFGDAAISERDRQIAKRIAEAGKVAGITVLDYVTVAKNGNRSLFNELSCSQTGGADYVAEGEQITLFDLLSKTERKFCIDGGVDKSLEYGSGKNVALRFVDLFAGIGGIRLAFERVGGKCVFTSEWDKPCQESYEANFGEKPHGDITKIDAKDVPDHDILTGGFPCQAFSIIGRKKGFADTRGTLFFDVERIIKEKKPKSFLLENVKQLKTHNGGLTFKVILERLENLDYFIHYKVLNGLNFGVPQKRERIMIVGFKGNHPFDFPLHGKKEQALADILEPEAAIEKKHFLSDYFKNKLRIKLAEQGKVPNIRPAVWHENKGGNIGIHPFSCALRANGSYNYLTVNGERRLTPREMLRLQGFPDSFKIVVPDSQARKQAGNSVVVPQIEAVARAIVQAMGKTPLPIVYETDLLGNKKIKRIYEH